MAHIRQKLTLGPARFLATQLRVGEIAGLSHPLIPFNPPFETLEMMIHPRNLAIAPSRNLVEVIDAQLVTQFLQLRADPLDPFQIVRARCPRLSQQFRLVIVARLELNARLRSCGSPLFIRTGGRGLI